MHTDLFSALLNRENRRGHPILAAMLYSFCPTAARWWIAGADPEPIFDPVWQAIKDWNSGTNLTEQLERYELERVYDVVSQYLKDVKACPHRNYCLLSKVARFQVNTALSLEGVSKTWMGTGITCLSMFAPGLFCWRTGDKASTSTKAQITT